jgi:branched-chain amino acid aminotransferase
MWYNVNGNIVEDMSFDPNNRSFKYGDGIFETIRFFNGKIFNKDNHIRRIEKSLKIVKINISISAQELLHIAIDLAVKNNIINGGLRINIYRSGLGKYSPNSLDGCFFIESYSFENTHFILNNNGLALDYYKTHLKSISVLSNLKTTSAIYYVLASIEKQERSLDDLLILNTNENPIEACSSNIFIVKDNKLITPSLQSGCLDGCMRALIVQNFDVVEQILTKEDIKESSEMFLTNSNSISWVKSLGSKEFSSYKHAKEVVRQCNDLI